VLCILHGYHLEGSGSNLWTRSAARGLCKLGVTFHIVCLENHPEKYDFISEAYEYDEDAVPKRTFSRETPHAGKCILHRPRLGNTLPVYVRDKYEEFENVVPMAGMSMEIIEDYLEKNLAVVSRVAKDKHITHFFVNHAVLMSVVAERLYKKSGIPYSIMPHGSAMTYAVERDDRLYGMAESSFASAKRIFVIGDEMLRRIGGMFPPELKLGDKLVKLNLGVDTELFVPVLRPNRIESIEKLKDALKAMDRGKGKDAAKRQFEGIEDGMRREDMAALLGKLRDYNDRLPDEDLEEKLGTVDWENDRVMIFVGRLIGNKGAMSILFSLPKILEEYPGARLIIVGHGPLREVLELMIWSIRSGNADMLKKIVDEAVELEDCEQKPCTEIGHFMQTLEESGTLERYLARASEHKLDESVFFTGYLTHDELRYLLPCADIAVFPSKVVEAGPMVALEALSSGVFIMGTYFGGMAQITDSIKDYLPTEVIDLMKLKDDDRTMVDNISLNAIEALKIDVSGRFCTDLRRMAVENHDWKGILRKMISKIEEIQSL
jgi:glycosyltransferase involved in cell wall biosynthesis